MKIRWNRCSIPLVLALCGGCIDELDELDERSVVPLTLSYAQDELTASLEHGDAFVVVKFRKGEMRPSEWRRDLAIDSPHLFDVALQDRNGALLILQVGGDEVIDPSWSDLVIPPPETSTLRERYEDFLLALELLDQLEALPDSGQAFAWEIRGLRTTVEATLQEKSFSGPTDLRVERTSLSPPLAQAQPTYTHQITIKKASCCWDFAEHSAVIVDSFDSANQYLASIVTANHGRQATDPSMSAAAYCPKSWGGRPNFFPVVQPYLAGDDAHDGDAGACNTKFGIADGKHVCNDDSLAEFYNVRSNSVSDWGTCKDDVLRAVAPHCNF